MTQHSTAYIALNCIVGKLFCAKWFFNVSEDDRGILTSIHIQIPIIGTIKKACQH